MILFLGLAFFLISAMIQTYESFLKEKWAAKQCLDSGGIYYSPKGEPFLCFKKTEPDTK